MKKILSFFLALIIVIGIVPIADLKLQANAWVSHTQEEAIEWIKARGNENWWQDVDSAYGCQCVDLIYAYYRYLIGYSLGGHAKNYLSSSKLPDGWWMDSTPSSGAIIVWGAYTWTGQWKTGENGHVGLVYSVQGSNVYTVETNTGNTNGQGSAAAAKFCTRVNCNAKYIHPDFSSILPPGATTIVLDKIQYPINVNIKADFISDPSPARIYLQITNLTTGNMYYDGYCSNPHYQSFSEPGNYLLQCQASNSAGSAPVVSKIFSVYSLKPNSPEISLSKKHFDIGEEINIIHYSDFSNYYSMSIYKDGNSVLHTFDYYNNYSTSFNVAGQYKIVCSAINDLGESSYSVEYFTVGYNHVYFYDNKNGNIFQEQTKVYNTDLIISENIPQKENYIFKEWNTLEDGTGTIFQPGSIYSINEDLILFAQWSGISAKEGSTAVIDGSYIYGLKTKLTAANIKNTFLDYEGVEVTLTKAIEDARYYGTGSTVTVKYSDGTEEVYTIIIFGDIDGNAIIDSDDAFSVLEASYDNSLFNAAQKKAANVDGVRRISIDDYSIINDAALGISEIDQTAV